MNPHGNTRLLILSAISTLLIMAAVWASRSAHGDPASRTGSAAAADGVGAENHVTWHKASSMKRALGGRVLMLDIRRHATSAPDPVFDAGVPFVDQDAADAGQMSFHFEFPVQADDALRAAHLTHASPVFLVCDDSRCGDLAAVLLHEHGYERVFVVSDPERSLRRAANEVN